MDEMSYKVIKEMLNEDYVDFIEVETYTTVQAIAALLEDSVMMMKKDRDNYISIIVALTELSLKSNTIPNYILERFTELSNDDIECYKYRDTSEFINSKSYIDVRMNKKDYNIYEDDYQNRVNILMGDR